MNAFEAIRRNIAPELELLNRCISDSLHTPDKLMSQVIERYLRSKGKLIRPVMVILTARLFGKVTPKVISAAASVEMLHNASLIHDDVVDDSRMRRGEATINAVWDNHIAVLVGDYFVSSALQQAISTGDIRIIDSLSVLGKTLSLGEIDQIYNARYHCLDEKAYFEVIGRKTASLFVSCVKMGAYAVGVDDDRLKALCRYAELLGLAFQIKDDIFDYFEDTAIGKPTGNDLREGKITLPLLYALNRKDMPGHQEMLDISRCDTLDEDDIRTLISYARRAGGIDYAYSVMEHLRDEAMEQLAKVAAPAATADFASLFSFIISRDH